MLFRHALSPEQLRWQALVLPSSIELDSTAYETVEMANTSLEAEHGALGGILTPNPRVRSAMLYTVELRGRDWSAWLDLNQRSPDSKSGRNGQASLHADVTMIIRQSCHDGILLISIIAARQQLVMGRRLYPKLQVKGCSPRFVLDSVHGFSMSQNIYIRVIW